MVEFEETCHTHIIPRLQKVINGEDQGGISKAVNWGINKAYNAEMLSEAICKLEDFGYVPPETEWWNHGTSSETDFIYLSTQNLSVEKLQQLSDEVGGDKTLLVYCGFFRCKPGRFENLTVKNLPKMVLSRCEWANDGYSLNIKNLPQMKRNPEQQCLLDGDDV